MILPWYEFNPAIDEWSHSLRGGNPGTHGLFIAGRCLLGLHFRYYGRGKGWNAGIVLFNRGVGLWHDVDATWWDFVFEWFMASLLFVMIFLIFRIVDLL